MNQKIAKWAYHSRIPFNAFDSPFFTAFMHSASFGAFNGPSGKAIGGRLLKQEVARTTEGLQAAITRHTIVHVQSDGVTDCLHIANFCVTVVVGDEAFFYAKYPNDGRSQNAEYYADKLSEVLNCDRGVC